MQQLLCIAPGCKAHKLASTWSPYCPAHRRALARNGHPLQASVLLEHLKPHLEAVQGWMKRNPQSPAWAILTERWQALQDNARAILARRDAGHIFVTHEANAAALLVQVADSTEPQEVITMALAMFMLSRAERSRFADDRGFLFTLVRRIRKLSPMAVGSYWNHKLQRMTKVYRDARPDVTLLLGKWLTDAFGSAGVQLAGLERDRQEHQRTRLDAAMGALQ